VLRRSLASLVPRFLAKVDALVMTVPQAKGLEFNGARCGWGPKQAGAAAGWGARRRGACCCRGPLHWLACTPLPIHTPKNTPPPPPNKKQQPVNSSLYPSAPLCPLGKHACPLLADVFILNFFADSPCKEEWRVLLQASRAGTKRGVCSRGSHLVPLLPASTHAALPQPPPAPPPP
jgi:hypothetical protein